MAKYVNTIVLNGFEEASEILQNSLKLYGIKEAAIYKNAEGKIEISMVGKVPKPVADLISLESGELIADYEGVDDATKKTGYVFPIDKCKQLMVDAFGFNGRFHEVISEEQDPISGEVKKELYYTQREGASESINDLLTEYIEAGINMIDTGDDAETVMQTAFETYNQILDLIGNSNLQEEVNRRLLEIITG